MQKVTLPFYTKTEEILNSVSHSLGIVLGIICMIISLLKATDSGALAGSTVFCVSTFVLYLCSTLYHSIKAEKVKKFLRLIDHSAIFILISGTIIAISLIAFLKYNVPLVAVIISLCVAVSAVGIILTFINHEKYKKVQMVLYMVLGWGAAVLAFPLHKYCEDPLKVLFFILTGGIVYTVGTAFYALGKKKRYFHSVFHFFVLTGTVLHFVALYVAL